MEDLVGPFIIFYLWSRDERPSGTIDEHGLIVEQGWKTTVGPLMDMV